MNIHPTPIVALKFKSKRNHRVNQVESLHFPDAESKARRMKSELIRSNSVITHGELSGGAMAAIFHFPFHSFVSLTVYELKYYSAYEILLERLIN